MSIDDDSYDIEAALKHTTEAVTFNRFMKWAYKNNERIEFLEKENSILKNAITIVSNPVQEIKNITSNEEHHSAPDEPKLGY